MFGDPGSIVIDAEIDFTKGSSLFSGVVGRFGFFYY